MRQKSSRTAQQSSVKNLEQRKPSGATRSRSKAAAAAASKSLSKGSQKWRGADEKWCGEVGADLRSQAVMMQASKAAAAQRAGVNKGAPWCKVTLGPPASGFDEEEVQRAIAESLRYAEKVQSEAAEEMAPPELMFGSANWPLLAQAKRFLAPDHHADAEKQADADEEEASFGKYLQGIAQVPSQDAEAADFGDWSWVDKEEDEAAEEDELIEVEDFDGEFAAGGGWALVSALA